MSSTTTETDPIEISFTATLSQGDVEPGGWVVVVVADSAQIFGTRQPVKVAGLMDGAPFETTMLPMGDGTHILPVKAALRKTIGKGPGDEVAIQLRQR